MQLLNRLSHYDQRVFLWCAALSQSFGYYRHLQSAARLVSRTGDGYLQVLLPLAILALAGWSAVNFFIAVIVAFILERCFYWLLKNSLKRRRPPVAIPSFKAAIIASDEFSFPSGHTSAAFLLAFITAAYLPILALPLFIWASCVGISRVLLGVHFPADIVAGMCLGGSMAWLAQTLLL